MKNFFKVIETPKFDVLFQKIYNKETERFEIKMTIAVDYEGRVDISLGYSDLPTMIKVFDSMNLERTMVLLAEMKILDLFETL